MHSVLRRPPISPQGAFEVLRASDPTHVIWRGRRLSYFGGCDYLRLGWDPRIRDRLRRAVDGGELGVAASRGTTGNRAAYERVEREIARFFQAEAAVLVPAGYLADLVVGQGMAGRFSHVVIDGRAHPALQDAARCLGGTVRRFRHRSPADLRSVVGRFTGAERLIVLTDGRFGHDGSLAPLPDYQAVLPASAWFLVDDAHAVGVLGDRGRGSLEHWVLARDRIIQTVTFSKAFGVFGGAVLASRAVCDAVMHRSRAWGGSTPLPLPWLEALAESLRILRREGRQLRAALARNTAQVRARCARQGAALPGDGPIFRIAPRDGAAARRLSRMLLEAGIYPPRIRYPAGSREEYFRLVVSAAHTPAQLDALADCLARALPGGITRIEPAGARSPS